MPIDSILPLLGVIIAVDAWRLQTAATIRATAQCIIKNARGMAEEAEHGQICAS